MPGGLCSACRNVNPVEDKPGPAVSNAADRQPKARDSEEETGGRVPPTPSGPVRHIDGGTLCAYCQRRPPLEGQQVCLHCQLDALYDLRTAADEAYENAEEAPTRVDPSSIRSLIAVLDEKRANTPTSRINPAGPPIIKNYRYK